MAMMIESIVRVSIVGQKRPINLASDLIWNTAGSDPTPFVKMMKGKSEINRLLGQPIAAGGSSKLRFTSIIEDLTQHRNDAITSMIESLTTKENKIDLGIDGPKKRRRGQPGPVSEEMWASLPEVIEVTAPACDTMDACIINVRVAKKPDPLFVELNQRTIDYLTAVVRHQIDTNLIHNKSKREQVSPDSRVRPPTGYSWSYKRNRLVKKHVVMSPTSRKKRVKTTYHKAVAAASSVACTPSEEMIDGDKRSQGGESGDDRDCQHGDDPARDSESELEELQVD